MSNSSVGAALGMDVSEEANEPGPLGFRNCLRKATYIKGEEYWCTECDNNIVKSDDPTTGTFFYQFGHSWDAKAGKTTDDYEQIIFAICHECLKGQGS